MASGTGSGHSEDGSLTWEDTQFQDRDIHLQVGFIPILLIRSQFSKHTFFMESIIYFLVKPCYNYMN